MTYDDAKRYVVACSRGAARRELSRAAYRAYDSARRAMSRPTWPCAAAEARDAVGPLDGLLSLSELRGMSTRRDVVEALCNAIARIPRGTRRYVSPDLHHSRRLVVMVIAHDVCEVRAPYEVYTLFPPTTESYSSAADRIITHVLDWPRTASPAQRVSVSIPATTL
jgi:hypothetical protein